MPNQRDHYEVHKENGGSAAWRGSQKGQAVSELSTWKVHPPEPVEVPQTLVPPGLRVNSFLQRHSGCW